MSYKKYLSDNSKKWIDIIKITLVFYFPRKCRYDCRSTGLFSNIVELLLLLYYTFMVMLKSIFETLHN